MTIRTTLLASVALCALALPAVAADCATTIQENDTWLRENAEVRSSLDAVAQRDIRDLRQAALILERNGQDDACEDVVDAMENIANESHERAKVAEAEADDVRIQRLETAVSLAAVPGVLRADALIGRDVRNTANDDLGEVDDVVLDTGEGGHSYAVVAYGGFLGLGEEQVAVPLSALSITEDGNILVLDMSKETFEAAPRFDRDDLTALSDETWIETNDRYFGGEG